MITQERRAGTVKQRGDKDYIEEPILVTFVADRTQGRCENCKGLLKKGETLRWQFKLEKHLPENEGRNDLKDYKVHEHCWRDLWLDYINGDDEDDDPPVTAPPRKVVQKDFNWVLVQLRKGETVRRKVWNDEKYLKMVVAWNDIEVHESIWVVTTGSKGPYSCPKYDTSAKDWELG